MKPRNKYLGETARLYQEYVNTGVRYRKVAEALVEAAGRLESRTVVDLGCGTGLLSRMLAERVGDHGKVVGVDASPDMLAVAKRTTKSPRVTFICALAEEVDHQVSGPIDVVVSSAAFCQFEREPTLAALNRLLDVGGRLAFNLSAGFFDFKASGLGEPDEGAYPYKQKNIIARWAALAQLRYPDQVPMQPAEPTKRRERQSLEELRSQLDAFGFTIQSAAPLVFEISRDDEHRWLQIPQWTDRLMPELGQHERVALLDEIFADVPNDAKFRGRWVSICAFKSGAGTEA